MAHSVMSKTQRSDVMCAWSGGSGRVRIRVRVRVRLRVRVGVMCAWSGGSVLLSMRSIRSSLLYKYPRSHVALGGASGLCETAHSEQRSTRSVSSVM